MSRPRKFRVIQNTPIANLYKPQGIPARNLKTVILPLEGLEALRLGDLEKMDHEKAAVLMEVSRPTFSRILSSARTVVAEAIINGWGIYIDGGNFIHKEEVMLERKEMECGDTPQKKQRGKVGLNENLKEITNEKNKMNKIIVSAMGTDLNAKVSFCFGRAHHFLLVDLDTMEFECIDNSKVDKMGSGAGIQTAEMVMKTGVKTVLTGGNVGPKAKAILTAAEISYIGNLSGLTVQEAVEKFKAEYLP